jgi:hypothetical protein
VASATRLHTACSPSMKWRFCQDLT